MSNRMYLAFLAGASFLDAGLHQALAIDAAPLPEPAVIYADQPAQAPVRMASADQSNMGGGFIQFLFGDAPPQGDRYRQQPGYQQQQPSYYQSQRPMLPIAYAAARAKLVAWDRFVIPMPFTRIAIGIGAPREVPRMATPQQIEALQIEMAQALKASFEAARNALDAN